MTWRRLPACPTSQRGRSPNWTAVDNALPPELRGSRRGSGDPLRSTAGARAATWSRSPPLPVLAPGCSRFVRGCSGDCRRRSRSAAPPRRVRSSNRIRPSMLRRSRVARPPTARERSRSGRRMSRCAHLSTARGSTLPRDPRQKHRRSNKSRYERNERKQDPHASVELARPLGPLEHPVQACSMRRLRT